MKAALQFAVALILAGLLAFAAHGYPINSTPIDSPVDALERLYFVCERAATNGTLSADGVAYCSMVYEQLKSRGFGGNVENLSAWAKARQSMQNADRR